MEVAVPLSEEENRLLEQMERALAAEDPKLASAMRGRTVARAAKLRTAAAGVVFLAGVALLMGGAMARLTWLSIAGFVVMLASAVVGLNAWRGRRASAASAPQPPHHPHGQDGAAGFTVIEGGKRSRSHRPRRQTASRPRRNGTFMQRMEQRWHERRDQGGL